MTILSSKTLVDNALKEIKTISSEDIVKNNKIKEKKENEK